MDATFSKVGIHLMLLPLFYIKLDRYLFGTEFIILY